VQEPLTLILVDKAGNKVTQTISTP
jgi:hypothetical protein